MTSPCISVILPVYNEEGNIAACLRGLSAALRDQEHEILVCYDLDEDTTLPAIEKMPDKPASVRPVKNTLGRGAAAAIRAGFLAARGDVLATTMADLSDPPEAILAMARKIRDEGADVVSGSRYMKGGSQTGGPRLKTLLSRAAGLSLRWVAGLGTHDATTNFRAYSRRFIEKVEVTSRHGMELALELTVKAHLGGWKVDEVPSSWRDRSAGESRFRLWSWLPRYLKWYLAAMADPLFVWTVLAGAAIAALVFAVRHAPPIPFIDEWWHLPQLTGRESVGPAWLWAQHNEHRIPLSKALWVFVERLSGADSRWGVTLNVLLFTLSSAVLVLALRRFRGQSAWTDAFIPLVLLHWDHWENLTWAFQVVFALHLLLTCVLIAMILDLQRKPAARLALPFGICLALLPLVGTSTLPYVALLAPWWAWVAFRSRPRIRPLLSLGLPAASLLLAAIQTLTFERPSGYQPSPGPLTSAFVGLEVLAGSLGFQGTRNWPTSGWIAAAATLLTLALLAWQGRRQLAPRGLFLALASLVLLSMLVGHSRAGFTNFAGFFERYVTLACLLPIVAYAATEFIRPAPAGRLARIALVVFMAFLFVPNARHASDLMMHRRYAESLLVRDVRAGMPVPLLARRHLYWYVDPKDPAGFARDLKTVAEARLALFRRLPLPDAALSWNGGTLRMADGRIASDLRPGASFSPELPPGRHELRLDFGRLSASTEEIRFRATRFRGDRSETVWTAPLIRPDHYWDHFAVEIRDGDRLRIDAEGATSGTWLLLERR